MIRLDYIELAYGKNRPVLTLGSPRVARGEQVAITGGQFTPEFVE